MTAKTDKDSIIELLEEMLDEVRVKRVRRVPVSTRLKRRRYYRKRKAKIKRLQKRRARRPRSKRLAKRRARIRRRLRLKPGSRRRIRLQSVEQFKSRLMEGRRVDNRNELVRGFKSAASLFESLMKTEKKVEIKEDPIHPLDLWELPELSEQTEVLDDDFAALLGIKPQVTEARAKVIVYDNGGKTADRYTVVIDRGHEKEFYTMSQNQGPQGINMFAGTDRDGLQMGPHNGRKVPLSTLSKDVQAAIKNRVGEGELSEDEIPELESLRDDALHLASCVEEGRIGIEEAHDILGLMTSKIESLMSENKDDDLDILKKYVEELGLDKKSSITLSDHKQLRDLLVKNDEDGLANYVSNLKDPNELEDLIVNVLYGDKIESLMGEAKKKDKDFEDKMKSLAKKTGLTFDGGDDNRLFVRDDMMIHVFANDMSKKEYDQMEKEMSDSEIKGKGYFVYAWNDESGYDYWNEEGKEDSSNYIQVTAAIEDPDKVDPKKLKDDVQKVYDKLSKWDNTESHEFGAWEKQESINENSKSTGIVKWYRADGTGYIVADDGSGTYYFDHTMLSKMTGKPQKGDHVLFVPSEIMKRKVAKSVETKNEMIEAKPQFKFLKYLKDKKPALSKSFDLVGLGQNIDKNSHIWVNRDGMPEFLIYYNSAKIIDDNMDEDKGLTKEIQKDFNKDYDGGGWGEWIKGWIEKKGGKVLRSGNTYNEDPYYFWGDVFEYTQFEDLNGKEGAVIMEYGGGDARANYSDPVVWVGDFDSVMSMVNVGDPDKEMAYIFGYDGKAQDLLSDVKSWLAPVMKKTESATTSGDDDSPQSSFEKHGLEPMMRKLAAHPAKKIKEVELDDGGVIKVMKATHPTHKSLIGIHLNNPSEDEIDGAIEQAAKDGFEYIWIHEAK